MTNFKQPLKDQHFKMQGTHRSISKYTDVGGRSVTFSVSAVYKDDSIHEGGGVRVRQGDTAGTYSWEKILG